MESQLTMTLAQLYTDKCDNFVIEEVYLGKREQDTREDTGAKGNVTAKSHVDFNSTVRSCSP